MGFPDSGNIYFFARRDFLMADLPLAEGFTSFLPLAVGFLEELPPEGFLMAGAAGLAFFTGLCFPLVGCWGLSGLGLGFSSLHWRGSAPRFWRRSLLHPVRKAAQDLSGGTNTTQSRAAVINLHK